MGGIKLGDLILDSRKVIYLPSLQAMVCADLHDALTVGIASGLKHIVRDMDGVMAEYSPRVLIFIGNIESEDVLSTIMRRWGVQKEVHFITSSPLSRELKELLELWGAMAHQELSWGGYRFADILAFPKGEHPQQHQLNIKVLNVVARPVFSLKIGRLLGGAKLSVFVKGFGRVHVPSMNPKVHTENVLKDELQRCDLFAINEHRVLPVGKVSDLKRFRGKISGLPLEVLTKVAEISSARPE